MAIDPDTVRRIARLARIGVADEALPALAEELSGVFALIETLDAVDVEGVEPMTAVFPMELKLRADEVTVPDLQAALLKNAPESREGFFAVPKVVE